MKSIFLKSLLLLLLISGASARAQEDLKPIYHPEADARKDIADAVSRAKRENKQVLLMIGGNWCSWCRMFDKFRTSNAKVDSTARENFIWLHVNYSKENKNEELMKSLGYPQRFGFPVFVVLDENGNRMHTQNSAYLEEGKGYSEEKVIEFFHQWRKDALNPENYRQ